MALKLSREGQVFELYTKAARYSLFYARQEAIASGSKAVEVRHLLLGMLQADPALCERVLGATGLEPLRERLAALAPEQTSEAPRTSEAELGFTRPSKVVLAAAMEAADELHSYAIKPAKSLPQRFPLDLDSALGRLHSVSSRSAAGLP